MYRVGFTNKCWLMAADTVDATGRWPKQFRPEWCFYIQEGQSRKFNFCCGTAAECDSWCTALELALMHRGNRSSQDSVGSHTATLGKAATLDTVLPPATGSIHNDTAEVCPPPLRRKVAATILSALGTFQVPLMLLRGTPNLVCAALHHNPPRAHFSDFCIPLSALALHVTYRPTRPHFPSSIAAPQLATRLRAVQKKADAQVLELERAHNVANVRPFACIHTHPSTHGDPYLLSCS